MALFWRHAVAVARKEVLATLRDRRALLTLILVPLLMLPAMAVLIPMTARFGGGEVARALKTTIGIEQELPSELRQQLQWVPGAVLSFVKVEDAREAAFAGKVSLGLVLDGKLPKSVTDAPAQVQIYAEKRGRASEAGIRLVERAVEAYNRKLQREHLNGLGLRMAEDGPLVSKVHTQTPFDVFKTAMSLVLPLLLVIWALAGCQATAIDATLGERERGTLEALLCAPVGALAISTGKLLGVAVFGVLASLCGLIGALISALLVSFGITAALGLPGDLLLQMIGPLALGPVHALFLLLFVLQVSLLQSALQLLPCSFARSYKEAQMYIAPAALLSVGACILAQALSLFDHATWPHWIPLAGLVIAFKQLLLGEGLSAWLPGAISTLGVTLVLLLVSGRVLRTRIA